uniref:SHSP domain-containing protein n=1 Tax=Spongospora subterranea TaxID=70186 RepID=A0A0H5QM66_9EUKA|eukprot:CRZ03240.1 hypothetical protein [Spongospora subterranea]
MLQRLCPMFARRAGRVCYRSFSIQNPSSKGLRLPKARYIPPIQIPKLLTEFEPDLYHEWSDMDIFATSPRPSVASVMPIDLIENDRNFELIIDIPSGVSKESLSVEIFLQNRKLCFSAERGESKPGDNAEYCKRERVWGRLRRNVDIPDNVAIDKMKATFSQGVLHLSMPKQSTTATETVPL